jgi:hypothetical protein
MADAWSTVDAAEVPHDLNLQEGEGHHEHGGASPEGVHEDHEHFGDTPAFDGDVIDHEEPTPAPRKRGKGARIGVVVGGVVLLGFVGLMVSKLVSGGHSQDQVVEATSNSTGSGNSGDSMLSAPQGAGAVGMLGDAASAPAATFPMGVDSAASSPSSSVASSVATATGTTPSQANQAAAPATGMATAAQQSKPAASVQQVASISSQAAPAPNGAVNDVRVANLEQRMDKVEGNVSTLMHKTSSKSSRSSRASAASPAASEAKSEGDEKAKPTRTAHSQRHGVGKTKLAQQTKPAESPKEEFIDPPELLNYHLQAVYPVQGADARAWIQDGQAVRVVARGDMLGSGRVLDVRRNEVVTSQGIVR